MISFGKTQLAAMGLSMSANSDLKQPDVVSTVSTILVSAGPPAIRDSTAGRTMAYSSRHDGLAQTIARLLRPIWNVKATVPIVGGRLILGVSERLLLSVQGRLERLRQYLDE